MTIRKRTGSLLLATAATTAAVVGLCAASAVASPLTGTTLKIKVTNGGKFTARARNTVLTDHGVHVNCATRGKTPASSAAGDIPSGTRKGRSPVKVGTANKLRFNNCSGPLGRVTTRIMAEPYKVFVDSKTNARGKTDGFISGVKVHVSMTGCSFNVTGSAPGFYTNSKHTLTMTSKLPVKPTTRAQLTIHNVSGCLGIVHNNDHPTFSSVFTLSRKGAIHSS